MPNFNRANLSLESLNVAINDALERAAATKAEFPRPYLGASIVGHECARRIQYDWWCKPVLAARTRENEWSPPHQQFVTARLTPR